MKKDKETFFRISFRDQEEGKVVTIKAKTICDSSLGISFVCIRDFLFETNSIVANPTDEQLRKRFENVKSIHISIYNILQIEELGLTNLGFKFSEDKSKLLVLSNSSQFSPN